MRCHLARRLKLKLEVNLVFIMFVTTYTFEKRSESRPTISVFEVSPIKFTHSSNYSNYSFTKSTRKVFHTRTIQGLLGCRRLVFKVYNSCSRINDVHISCVLLAHLLSYGPSRNPVFKFYRGTVEIALDDRIRVHVDRFAKFSDTSRTG